MNSGPRTRDIAGITFLVLCIGGLIAVNFWILSPFLLALIWATIIVVATWPIMLFFQRWLGGRRSLAVALMTLALLLVFIVPFSLAVGTIVENTDRIVEWVKGLEDFSLPPLPDWVGKLPMVGTKLNEAWQDAAAIGSEGWLARLAPHAGEIVKWFTGQAGSIGMLFVQFFLTLVIAAVLYSNGETAALAVRRFTFRLAGQKAEESVILAAQNDPGRCPGHLSHRAYPITTGGDRLCRDGCAVCGIAGGDHLHPRPGATSPLSGHGARGHLAVLDGRPGLGDRASRMDDRCQRP